MPRRRGQERPQHGVRPGPDEGRRRHDHELFGHTEEAQSPQGLEISAFGANFDAFRGYGPRTARGSQDLIRLSTLGVLVAAAGLAASTTASAQGDPSIHGVW